MSFGLKEFKNVKKLIEDVLDTFDYDQLIKTDDNKKMFKDEFLTNKYITRPLDCSCIYLYKIIDTDNEICMNLDNAKTIANDYSIDEMDIYQKIKKP
jgi:hypothetical protein